MSLIFMRWEQADGEYSAGWYDSDGEPMQSEYEIDPEFIIGWHPIPDEVLADALGQAKNRLTPQNKTGKA
jgi:hypothetical protein